MLSSGSEVAIAQLQAEIEIERQAQSIQVLQKTKQLALAEAEQTNLRTTLFWSTLIAGLLTLFLIWSRYTQRQQTIRLRREVKQRTKELEQKNSELQTAYKTLEQVSLHDSLTGLYNRHYLESQLPGNTKRASIVDMKHVIIYCGAASFGQLGKVISHRVTAYYQELFAAPANK